MPEYPLSEKMPERLRDTRRPALRGDHARRRAGRARPHGRPAGHRRGAGAAGPGGGRSRPATWACSSSASAVTRRSSMRTRPASTASGVISSKRRPAVRSRWRYSWVLRHGSPGPLCPAPPVRVRGGAGWWSGRCILARRIIDLGGDRQHRGTTGVSRGTAAWPGRIRRNWGPGETAPDCRAAPDRGDESRWCPWIGSQWRGRIPWYGAGMADEAAVGSGVDLHDAGRRGFFRMPSVRAASTSRCGRPRRVASSAAPKAGPTAMTISRGSAEPPHLP